MQLLNLEATATMSSREIAELTGKELSNVHRDIRNMLNDLKKDDSDLNHPTETKDARGYTVSFHLDRDFTDCLLTSYSAVARMRVIKRWRTLESQKAPVHKAPQTLSEALMLGAELAKKVEEQTQQLAIAAPKVAIYEMLADRKQDVSTTIIAKQLGTSSIKLNQFLRDKGVKWLNADLPKAGFMEWFNIVSDVKNGHEFQQCMVTPHGQLEIAKLWAKP